MTTRVGVGGPGTGVFATATAPRVTPEPARPFQQVMNVSSTAIINGAQAAVTHLPGGGILAAAMRPGVPGGSYGSYGGASIGSASAYAGGGVLAGAPGVGVGATGGSVRAEGSSGTAVSGPGGVGTSTSGGAPNLEQVMSQDADQNLYYLKLQEQMSAESRGYSAISNVLKARHDTMKNAIGNIR